MGSKKTFLKKKKQLGVHPSTAANQLKKKILFSLIKLVEFDTCYQCGEKITVLGNLSIEHKVPWLDSDDPRGLYFDLNNIVFSHLKCNLAASRGTTGLKNTWAKTGPRTEHGTYARYKYGCRCEECRAANTKEHRKYRKKNTPE